MSDLSLDWNACEGVPSAVAVVAKGQVGSGNAQRFIEVLDAALVGPVCTLLLDIEEVPFVSSTALSYLADLIWHLEARGGAVALIRVHPKLKVVLTSLNLLQFFKTFDDPASALAFAKEQAARLRTQSRIAIVKGPGQGAEYPVGPTAITIGSDPAATIHIAAPRIATKHAEIFRKDEICLLRDLGSKAGTTVDGRRITGEEPLKPGAVVRVADLELLFSGPEK